MAAPPLTRRQALATAGLAAAGSAFSPLPTIGDTTQVGQPTRGTTPPRLAPRTELVNTLEYEAQAKLALAPDAFARLAGSDRAPFDRITFRPRMMVPALDLDLSLTLFSQSLFAPIIVAPMADQQAWHPDADKATATGAAAAKTPLIVSSRSRVPLPAILAATTTPVWFQAFASDAAAATQVQDAVSAGVKAICVTIGAAPEVSGTRVRATNARRDWDGVAALRSRVSLPLIVKGVVTPADAKRALEHRVDGIIVSNYGTQLSAGEPPILSLPGIVDAVAGKVPVLVDGSFRRGTDILKALAFGAKAALIGRPVMWGLAAYGSEGVQGVLEMLQTELGRYMGMCGKVNLAALDRSLVVVHAARPVVGERRDRS